MKYWGIIICLFISFQINLAQNKIYVGANFSPSLCYLAEAEGTKPGLTYSTGIEGLYFLDNHLSIKTGINFGQKSFVMEDLPDTQIGNIDINGDGIIDLRDDINYDEVYTFDVTSIFQSVNLSLNVNYKISDEHKTGFVVSMGVELGYYYNTKFVLDYSNGEKTTRNLNYKELMTEFNIGLGFYKPVSDKFLLQVIPKYSYSVYNDRRPKNMEFHSIKLDVEFYFQLN